MHPLLSIAKSVASSVLVPVARTSVTLRPQRAAWCSMARPLVHQQRAVDVLEHRQGLAARLRLERRTATRQVYDG